MRTLTWNQLTAEQQQAALKRPALAQSAKLTETVTEIITAIRERGDEALLEYTRRFDRLEGDCLILSPEQIDAACARVAEPVKQAIEHAYDQVKRFHQAQASEPLVVETMPGVVCELHTRPIESVGLYVPGGSAPLPSTVLMLAAPAEIAGCRTRILCSPPPVADEIIYAARVCGVQQIITAGGAQAVAAMAYGTASVPKVDKIFGPGNAFVTEAKRLVSMDFGGAAIDMPAGPSEVLVIADADAEPAFVAADLLSQAEHGADSQAILVTPSQTLAEAVAAEVESQLAQLSRQEIARQSIGHSLIIVCDDLAEAVQISNRYAPEHLIVQVEDARALLPKLDNAGSVFLGPWSPESVGDYASGTNHTLPTYGYTRTYSSLGLADFLKRFTVQELSQQGLKGLATTVTTLADAEGLDAHKRAVTVRLDKLKECP